MAKIKHNDSFTTYKDILDRARSEQLLHLQDDSDVFNGRAYQVNGSSLLNFGYCGYLGLEMHESIKQGATDYIQKHGLQYGVSRVYMTSSIERKLLALLSEMYGGQKIIVFSSTSSAHIGNIPNIIEGNDAIILDQQAHFSLQTGAQLCRQKGTHIEMIRHVNLEMLERRYQELAKKYRRVWYITDGVYSMYGDTMPGLQLKKKLNELKQLYMYVDDAHGMSWKGATGGGYVYDEVGYHPKMILTTTMGKAFGVTGGIAIYPTNEFYEKVRTFGGPQSYSHPLSPAIIGAATASAELHLSSEFKDIQQDLASKINYCSTLLSKLNLPQLSNSETPIFFLGLGQPKVAYNLVKRVMNEGFYVNVALFPGVPIKNSGFRFSISRHNGYEDIKALVECIGYHYDRALAEENTTDNEIRKAFRLPAMERVVKVDVPLVQQTGGGQHLKVERYTSITQINRDIWDSYFTDKGSFDWEGLLFLENAFKGNSKKRENWDFHYLIVTENGTIQAATFLTSGYAKDDIFAEDGISQHLEKRREENPDFMVSKTLMMGSLLTEGEHLYINPRTGQKEVLEAILNEVEKIQEETGAEKVVLRDFDKGHAFKDWLFDRGFVALDMPNTNVLEFSAFSGMEEFKRRLKARRRAHFNRDVEPYYHQFTLQRNQKLNEEELAIHYRLFENVRERNLGINVFPYPAKMLKEMNTSDRWEIMALYLEGVKNPVATMWVYKGLKTMAPMLIGLDYNYMQSHKLYKQCLYRVIEAANASGYHKLYFGFSADLEKRKLGAEQHAKVSYIRAEDNYAMDMMESMAKVSYKA